MSESPRHWFSSDSVDNPTVRLLIFPYAGGGTAAFRSWIPGLPSSVGLTRSLLPGREDRLLDSPYNNLDLLVADLLSNIVSILDRPFALFGHSMGALIAYELARQLSSAGQRSPSLLMVSAHRAPHLPDRRRPVHKLSDTALIDELSRYSGTHPDVLANEELLSLVLPTFRSDLELCETYQWRPARRLHCPILVLGGIDDENTMLELEQWREHTTESCTIKLFPGGHFFLDSARTAVLSTISDALLAVTAGQAGESRAR